jgi:hypothetical protein
MKLRSGVILGLFFAGLAGAEEASLLPTTSPTAQVMSIDPNAAALRVAVDDAANKLFQTICDERLSGQTRIGDLLTAIDGTESLRQLLTRAEQIGGPRFLSPEHVQVRLDIDGRRVAMVVLDAVRAAPERSMMSVSDLESRLNLWSARRFTAVGDNLPKPQVGTTRSAEVPADGRQALAQGMPEWASSPILASGVASRDGTPLQTARAAEDAARDALRDAILQLQFSGNVERIVDVPQFADLVDEAVLSARIVGVDYRADGSAQVRVSIEGRSLWLALQNRVESVDDSPRR